MVTPQYTIPKQKIPELREVNLEVNKNIVKSIPSNIKKGVEYLKGRQTQNIIEELQEQGVNVTEENIERYRKELNPFTSERLGLYDVLGFGGKKELVTETGETIDVIQESGPNVPSLLAIGALSSPTSFTRTIPTIQRTNIFGTIERLSEGSKIKAVGKVTGGKKPTYIIAEETIPKVSNLGLGKGYTYQIERNLKIPSTNVLSLEKPRILPKTKLKNINKFISASITKQLGKVRVVKEIPPFKVSSNEIGRGSLVRSRTITKEGVERDIFGFITRRRESQPNIIRFIGGEPKLRVGKKGIEGYVIRNPNVRGTLIEVTKEGRDKGFSVFRSVKQKPKKQLELTQQEEQSLGGLVSSIMNIGKKSLKSQEKTINYGEPSLLFRSGSGMVSLESTRNIIGDISSFNLGFNKEINKQTQKNKIFTTAKEEELDTNEDVKISQKEKSSLSLSTKTLQFEKQKQPQLELLAQPQITLEKETPIFKQVGITKPKTLQKKIPIQIQIVSQKTTQKQPLTTKTKIIQTPKTPKIPKLKLPFTPKKKKGKKKKIIEDEFEVFVRKGGEDISIGEFGTLPQASKELFSTLREEIRASGFVTKDGEKIKLNLMGTEFRPSKVEPFRVVEPKRRRIKKGTQEPFQIKASRKSGGFF